MSKRPLLNRKALLLFITLLMLASLASTASTQQMKTISVNIFPMCGDSSAGIKGPLEVRVDGNAVPVSMLSTRGFSLSIGSHEFSLMADGQPVVIRNAFVSGYLSHKPDMVFPGGSTSITVPVGNDWYTSTLGLRVESCGTNSNTQPKTDDSASSACDRYESLITTAAYSQGISSDFLCRIIKAEGTPTYDAENHPATYRARGVRNLSDPNEVIPAMAKLLSDYLRQFGTECLAAAALDAGPAAVQKYHGVPSTPGYQSTRQFVTRVTGDARACDNINPENSSAILATVRALHGDVSRRSNGGSFVDLDTTGTQLSEGDDISTGPDGEVTLAFSDGSTVELKPNTQCNIGELSRQRGDVRIRINLKIGEVEAKISKSETATPSFSVKTPNSVASVRGTVFNVRYDGQAQTTTVAVEEGTVDVASDNSSAVAVSAGQQVQVAEGEVGPVVAANGETDMEPRYLGCYKDTGDLDLNGWLERSRSNTPQRCIAVCRDRGFKYAAVQYGESCLCGQSYGKYGPATNCDYRCTGDPNQICGGYSANSVYQIR